MNWNNWKPRLELMICAFLGIIAGSIITVVTHNYRLKHQPIPAPYNPLINLYPWQDGSYRPVPEKHQIKGAQ